MTSLHDQPVSRSAWRPSARLILVAVLCLTQVFWWLFAEWPMPPFELVGHALLLVLGGSAAITSRRRWLSAIGFGLLLLEPSIVGVMTALLGSVAPVGRTGIEMFGTFGFSIAVAFVLGYWVDHWLGRVAEGHRRPPLSPRALFGVLLLLCSLSILGALGELLLEISYPDGLIPTDTWWGRAMVTVMVVSAPAELAGVGLLVVAAPVAVRLVSSAGLSSGVGRAAVAVSVIALLGAAITLSR